MTLTWNSQPARIHMAYSFTSFRILPKYHLLSKAFLDHPVQHILAPFPALFFSIALIIMEHSIYLMMFHVSIFHIFVCFPATGMEAQGDQGFCLSCSLMYSQL